MGKCEKKAGWDLVQESLERQAQYNSDSVDTEHDPADKMFFLSFYLFSFFLETI